MVSNVSFNGKYSNLGQYSKDIENVTKYALGTTIVNSEESPFQGMGLMLGISGVMEGSKGVKWVKANKSDLSGGWKKGLEAFKADLAVKKDLFSNGGWKTLTPYQTAWNNYSSKVVSEAIPTGDKFTKLSKETQNVYKEAEEAAKLASTSPTESRNFIKLANKKLAEANKLANLEHVNTPMKDLKFFGKVGKFLGKYTGATKLNTALKELATTSPATAKLLKYGKGNGWFVALTGGIELLTQVIPAFNQLGAGSGAKQVVKSTAKTAASVGGWVGGMAVGSAIGSVLPGAGTVIGGIVGALVGMVGGTIGSWAATKATEDIIGKSELDIAKEKEANKIAHEAIQDPQQMKQLMATVAQKLQTEGTESEDAKVALKSIRNLTQVAQNANPFA